jgi:hypothetical protein
LAEAARLTAEIDLLRPAFLNLTDDLGEIHDRISAAQVA